MPWIWTEQHKVVISHACVLLGFGDNKTILDTVNDRHLALIDIDELQDVVTLALALILKLLVSVSKIRNDVCLLSVLLLELLAAAK